LFLRELRAIGLEDVYHPVKGAANYSLLYVVIRIVRELGPKSILELGAGETTRLLSALIDKGLTHNVDTIEGSEYWANRISNAATNVNVIHAPLSERRFEGLSFVGYDLKEIEQKRYDLIIIDGPNGTAGVSRASGLEVAAKCLSPEFIIVIDDAERLGERRMMRCLLRLLKVRGLNVKRQTTRSINWQIVVATSSFEAALYF